MKEGIFLMSFFGHDKHSSEREAQAGDGEWITVTGKQWHPEEGESVEGRLVEKKPNMGRYNQKLYIIETPLGEEIEVWGTVQLNKIMEKVYINDYIRLTFNGTCKTRKNKQMNLYNLSIKR